MLRNGSQKCHLLDVRIQQVYKELPFPGDILHKDHPLAMAVSRYIVKHRHAVSQEGEVRACKARLAEADEDVLGDLPEDIHVDNVWLALVVGSCCAVGEHAALIVQPQPVPLHRRARQHRQHAHQQPIPCA